MTMQSVGQILGMCDHADAQLAIQVANNGLCVWCARCNSNVTKERGYPGAYIGRDHPTVQGVDFAALPRIGEKFYRACSKCRRFTECHAHHIMPRKLAPGEADTWPLVYLCPPCHRRWHRIVTPGLCTAYNPAEHVRMLATYLPPESLDALRQALAAHLHVSEEAA